MRFIPCYTALGSASHPLFPPNTPKTLHLQSPEAAASYVSLPMRTDLLTIHKGSIAKNRYSCIAHAAAGQTKRHVEMKDGERRRERQGSRQEGGRASDVPPSFVQVDRGYAGRCRSGGYFLAMGRLSTHTPGTRGEKTGIAATPGFPGHTAYLDLRASFMHVDGTRSRPTDVLGETWPGP